MQILTNEVNFGKVLLNSNPVNSLIIQNLGNTESGDYSGSSDIYPFKIENKFR
jgi:hypothetical protein